MKVGERVRITWGWYEGREVVLNRLVGTTPCGKKGWEVKGLHSTESRVSTFWDDEMELIEASN